MTKPPPRGQEVQHACFKLPVEGLPKFTEFDYVAEEGSNEESPGKEAFVKA